MGARIGAMAAIAALLLCACTHERKGPVGQHYVDFSTRPPRNNTVYVCHAYGCRDADAVPLHGRRISRRWAR